MKSKISVDIVVPVYNEEVALPANIPLLYNYCQNNLRDYRWRIVIVDNASEDQTPDIVRRFSRQPRIDYIRLDERGRGLALRIAWLASTSTIVSYMDIDLSSNLNFFPALLTAIENGHDVAIGSRRTKGANVTGRTPLRKLMSWGLNFLINILFSVSFRDAQCGFKAMKRSAFQRLEPLIKNNQWFFDSELLVVAEKSGLKIAEIPIAWHDDPSSTVRITKTIMEDMGGMLRLLQTKPWEKIT